MTALLGFLFLVIGNGGVVWAEQRVPSGLTSLLVAVTPIWTALAMWALPGGRAPSGGMIVGLLTGFLGTALLVAPGHVGGAPVDAAGAVALNLASLSWALGSVLTSRLDLPRSGQLSSGLQMLSAGAMLFLLALATGDIAALRSFRRHGAVARRAAVPHRLRLAGRVQRIRVAAAGEHAGAPVHDVLRESHRGRLPGLAAGGRVGEPAHLHRGRADRGAVAVIVTVRGRR